MLGTGKLSITNLFYAVNTSPSTMFIPQKVINGRHYSFLYRNIGGTVVFVDDRPEIVESTQLGEEIRRFTPEFGIWNFGRNSSWHYNPKDNHSYTLVRLKSDHPDNTTEDDNEVWLMKVDMANFERELIIKVTGSMHNVTILIDIVNNEVYTTAANNNNPTFLGKINMTTGEYSTIRNTDAYSYVGNVDNNYLLKDSWSGHVIPQQYITFVRYNFSTNTYIVEMLDIYENINPIWLNGNAGNYLLNVNHTMLILGSLLYIPVSQTSLTVSGGANPVAPHTIDVLVYNAETLEFIHRLEGGALSASPYPRFNLLDNFTLMGNTSAGNPRPFLFYAPEVLKVDTMLKIETNELLKSPDV